MAALPYKPLPLPPQKFFAPPSPKLYNEVPTKANAAASDPAVSLFFSVSIDTDQHPKVGVDLGDFTSCDGLGFEVAVEQREEGGNNGFVHQLPGRIKYSNIKLTRPLNRDSAVVAKWFSSMGGTIVRTQAVITARRPDGKAVATWTLRGVIPVKWSGPQLSVDTAKVAMETLELAHHGFLDIG